MNQIFDVIIEKDLNGYYVSTVPVLKGCHTQAKSLDELIERTREVIGLCLEVEKNEFESNEFIGIQRLSVKV
jgi:predicted RNase H-like HicB family nuclease